MARISIIIFLLVSATSCSASFKASGPSEPPTPAVFRICNTKGCGTAWYMSKDIVVTAAHVIKDPMEPIVLYIGAVNPVKHYLAARDIDRINDVAVLEDLTSWDAPVLPICSSPPYRGDTVHIYGYRPNGLTSTRAIIHHINHRNIEYSTDHANPMAGISGGPIILGHQSPCVIGIHQSSKQPKSSSIRSGSRVFR